MGAGAMLTGHGVLEDALKLGAKLGGAAPRAVAAAGAVSGLSNQAGQLSGDLIPEEAVYSGHLAAREITEHTLKMRGEGILIWLGRWIKRRHHHGDKH